MMYYNFKKHKEFLFLDLFVCLIPISIILGNLVINTLTIICISIYGILSFKRKIFYRNYYYTFFVIIIFFSLNLILSSNFQLTFISLLGFIRYYLLFLTILFCLNEIENFKSIFGKIILISVLFVIFDLLIQHFFSVDLFGNQIMEGHGRRLSGPFGDESVAGSFISKLFFLSFLFFLKNSLIKKLIIPIIIISIFTVILTNERSSSIMFFIATLFFFIFCDLKLWKKFFLLIFTIFSLTMFMNSNHALRTHFVDIPIKYFQDNHHKAHYLTAYEIFKNNKIFGSGTKTFRYVCGDKKYEKIKTKYVNNRCATHPHNIYLEILSETGIIGMLIFLIINFYILMYLIISFFKKNMCKQNILLLFCGYFVLFWPLQTTGSFFSTWNGIFYWLFFSFFFHYKTKLAIKSK